MKRLGTSGTSVRKKSLKSHDFLQVFNIYRNCFTCADKKWKCISSSEEQVTWLKIQVDLLLTSQTITKSHPTKNASDKIV